MQVIEYLKKNGLESLKENYGIKTCHHEDGRVILNYSQIDSPKFDPISDECRGLVLDEDFNLVARSFKRFYNIGERISPFNYSDCISTEKVDGSLALIHTYDNSVHMNTRGSFGKGEVNGYPITWHDLLSQAIPDWRERFKCDLTFVGEICSKYNRVVIPYDEPVFYLLTVFDGENELSFDEVQELAYMMNLYLPKTYNLSGEKDVVDFIEKQDGKYFEGLVLRSGEDRIKAKNSLYVSLHHTFSNSAAILPKNIVPIILKGEEQEVISYFPEFKKEVLSVKNQLDDWYCQIEELWEENKNVEDQKEFALNVKNHPLCSLLFQARRYNKSIDDLWYDSEEFLIKLIKDKHG